MEGESLHFLRSVWLWMSPLCSRLAIFYRVPRPGRQKMAASSTAAQNLCIFCGQCGCGCRHSAAVWPFSIGCPALGAKKWQPLQLLRRISAFLRYSSAPGDRISASLRYSISPGGRISAFLRCSSAPGPESLHFYGALAHLVSAWRGSKTVPGRRETKKAQFEQNFNLKMVVSEQPSKKEKILPSKQL